MDEVLDKLKDDHLMLELRKFAAMMAGDSEEIDRLHAIQLGLARAVDLLTKAKEKNGELVGRLLVPSHN